MKKQNKGEKNTGKHTTKYKSVIKYVLLPPEWQPGISLTRANSAPVKMQR